MKSILNPEGHILPTIVSLYTDDGRLDTLRKNYSDHLEKCEFCNEQIRFYESGDKDKICIPIVKAKTILSELANSYNDNDFHKTILGFIKKETPVQRITQPSHYSTAYALARNFSKLIKQNHSLQIIAGEMNSGVYEEISKRQTFRCLVNEFKPKIEIIIGPEIAASSYEAIASEKLEEINKGLYLFPQLPNIDLCFIDEKEEIENISFAVGTEDNANLVAIIEEPNTENELRNLILAYDNQPLCNFLRQRFKDLHKKTKKWDKTFNSIKEKLFVMGK